jgi:hypothetical protein
MERRHMADICGGGLTWCVYGLFRKFQYVVVERGAHMDEEGGEEGG